MSPVPYHSLIVLAFGKIHVNISWSIPDLGIPVYNWHLESSVKISLMNSLRRSFWRSLRDGSNWYEHFGQLTKLSNTGSFSLLARALTCLSIFVLIGVVAKSAAGLCKPTASIGSAAATRLTGLVYTKLSTGGFAVSPSRIKASAAFSSPVGVVSWEEHPAPTSFWVNSNLFFLELGSSVEFLSDGAFLARFTLEYGSAATGLGFSFVGFPSRKCCKSWMVEITCWHKFIVKWCDVPEQFWYLLMLQHWASTGLVPCRNAPQL